MVAGASRPAAVGCTPASIEVVQVAVAPQTVIEEDDADSDIEAYHPDPHPGLDSDAALLAEITAAEAVLAPGSGASAVQREGAEEALLRCDLPLVDADAIGHAHAAARVCSFLDTWGGGVSESAELEAWLGQQR